MGTLDGVKIVEMAGIGPAPMGSLTNLCISILGIKLREGC